MVIHFGKSYNYLSVESLAKRFLSWFRYIVFEKTFTTVPYASDQNDQNAQSSKFAFEPAHKQSSKTKNHSDVSKGIFAAKRLSSRNGGATVAPRGVVLRRSEGPRCWEIRWRSGPGICSNDWLHQQKNRSVVMLSVLKNWNQRNRNWMHFCHLDLSRSP